MRRIVKRAAFGAGYAWGTVVFNPRVMLVRRVSRNVGHELRSDFREGKSACARQIREEAERASARLAALEEAMRTTDQDEAMLEAEAFHAALHRVG